MDTKTLFKIGYGLYILTANSGGRDNGCVINTLMQVTSGPPATCVVAVNKQNLTHDMIMETGVFNVSVLTERAPFDVFRCFGFQSGRTADKLDGFAGVARSENGLLYLAEHSNAYLSFRVTEPIDFDTHTMFRAEMTDAQVLSDDESVTYTYYQKHIKPKPQAQQSRGYRCTVCGYVYEGEPLPPDFICPICKHGADAFVKIDA